MLTADHRRAARCTVLPRPVGGDGLPLDRGRACTMAFARPGRFKRPPLNEETRSTRRGSGIGPVAALRKPLVVQKRIAEILGADLPQPDHHSDWPLGWFQ